MQTLVVILDATFALSTLDFLATITETVYRTESIVFWTGLQCSNEPPQDNLCERGLAIFLNGRQ